MGVASQIAMAVGTFAVLGSGQAASAQPLASVSPSALAGRLPTQGIDPAMGFRMSRPVTCMPGSSGDNSAYHCVAAIADSARGGKTAAIEFLIFNGGYDFAARDAQVKASIIRMGGRWSLDHESEVKLHGKELALAVTAACHQSRGQVNSPAYCLLPVAANVLIFSQVPPAQASSDSVSTSENGGSFDDMARAGNLASLGALAVVKALQGQSAGRAPASTAQPTRPVPTLPGISDSIIR